MSSFVAPGHQKATAWENRGQSAISHTITRNRYGAPTVITQYGPGGPGGVGGSVSVSKHLYYNAQQRLCRSTEPETGSTLFGYDAAGRLV